MKPAVATPQEQLDRIDKALASGDPAMKTVVRDGTTVTWDRAQLLRERAYWEKVAERRNRRRLFHGLNPGGAW